MSDLIAEKKALRMVMKNRRVQAQKDNPQAAIALRDVFLKHIHLPLNSVVATYIAFGDEMHQAPISVALSAQGHPLALPVVMGREDPLHFRRYNIGDRLAINRLGISEPLDTAPEVVPDVILLPLLAFDGDLQRLGYGGGFYDRTVAALRKQKHITTIGLAFSCQEVAAVPHEAHDVCLDKIVTENQIFSR